MNLYWWKGVGECVGGGRVQRQGREEWRNRMAGSGRWVGPSGGSQLQSVPEPGSGAKESGGSYTRPRHPMGRHVAQRGRERESGSRWEWWSHLCLCAADQEGCQASGKGQL